MHTHAIASLMQVVTVIDERTKNKAYEVPKNEPITSSSGLILEV
jgi:hypothetical protein